MKRNPSVPSNCPWDECADAGDFDARSAQARAKTRAGENDEWVESQGVRESRRSRSPQVPGGIYYIVKRSRHAEQSIFGDALEYAMFERLLALALARYRCRLHAFCWEPAAIHLVAEVSDRPVGRFLQWLCSWYSRSVSEDAGRESLFERSYRAVLVEPGQGLLKVIRYLHLRPVSGGALADSALSSHRAYLGIVHIPWLTTSVALRMLGPSLAESRFEYRWMMQRKEKEPAALLARGQPFGAGVTVGRNGSDSHG